VSLFSEVHVTNVHTSNILPANEWQCLLFYEINFGSKGSAKLDRPKGNKKSL
jgi:hypothetical protein